jgi:hypothetical protein
VRLVDTRDEVNRFSDDWDKAASVPEQRAVLNDALTRVLVARGAWVAGPKRRSWLA